MTRWLVVGGLALAVLGTACEKDAPGLVWNGGPMDGGTGPPPTSMAPMVPSGWSTALGQMGFDGVDRMVRGERGNLIISGFSTTRQVSGPEGPGLSSSTVPYIGSVSASGKLLWVRSFQGEFNKDLRSGLAVDAQGDIYYAGSFSGTAIVGSHELTAKDGTDILVVRLDPAGVVRWAATAGSPGAPRAGQPANHAYQVHVHTQGAITIAGSFAETVQFGPSLLTARGQSDAFVARLDPEGEFLWAVQLHSPVEGEPARAYGLAVDDLGDSHVTGSWVASGEQPTMFVAKVSAAGERRWAVSPPAGHRWEGLDIAADRFGNSFVAGWVKVPPVDPPLLAKLDLTKQGLQAPLLQADQSKGPGRLAYQPGAMVPTPVVARVDPEGEFRWEAHGVGNGDGLSYASGVSVNAQGDVLLTGSFTGIRRFGHRFVTASGPQDGFVAGIDRTGKVLWAGRFGGDGVDSGVAVTSGPGPGFYLAGNFQGTMCVCGNEVTSHGASDILVWKATELDTELMR